MNEAPMAFGAGVLFIMALIPISIIAIIVHTRKITRAEEFNRRKNEKQKSIEP